MSGIAKEPENRPESKWPSESEEGFDQAHRESRVIQKKQLKKGKHTA